MSDKKYEDYGFYWNPREKKLIINGEEHTHVTKASLTLTPNEVVKVEIEKLMLTPITLVEGKVDLEIKNK